MKRLLVLLLWLNLVAGALASPTPKNGDFIFQDFNSRMRPLIAGVTQSSYTHCGIVVIRDGQSLVLEAIGPVRYTPLVEWIRRGEKYSLYRYRDSSHITPTIRGGEAYLGRPYDYNFVLGGDELYCSELLYRAALEGAHVELSHPQALAELNWRPWEKEIRALRAGNLPLQETLVSPIALTRSPALVCVYRGF